MYACIKSDESKIGDSERSSARTGAQLMMHVVAPPLKAGLDIDAIPDLGWRPTNLPVANPVFRV